MDLFRTDSRNCGGAGAGGGDWWVFGFGSLMWDPGFAFAEQRPARVHGWHRRFTLLSNESWGSRDRPGLCAALHPGGSVWGRAFRVAEPVDGPARRTLEHRERAYRHVMVRASFRDGGQVDALSFAFNPECPRFDTDLDDATRCVLITQGMGAKGSSLGYLEKVVGRLRDDGSVPGRCAGLLRAVRNGGHRPTGQGQT